MLCIFGAPVAPVNRVTETHLGELGGRQTTGWPWPLGEQDAQNVLHVAITFTPRPNLDWTKTFVINSFGFPALRTVLIYCIYKNMNVAIRVLLLVRCRRFLRLDSALVRKQSDGLL